LSCPLLSRHRWFSLVPSRPVTACLLFSCPLVSRYLLSSLLLSPLVPSPLVSSCPLLSPEPKGSHGVPGKGVLECSSSSSGAFPDAEGSQSRSSQASQLAPPSLGAKPARTSKGELSLLVEGAVQLLVIEASSPSRVATRVDSDSDSD